MVDRNIGVRLTKFFQHRAGSIDTQGAVEDQANLLLCSFDEPGLSLGRL
jgi:hypothetical protein